MLYRPFLKRGCFFVGQLFEPRAESTTVVLIVLLNSACAFFTPNRNSLVSVKHYSYEVEVHDAMLVFVVLRQVLLGTMSRGLLCVVGQSVGVVYWTETSAPSNAHCSTTVLLVGLTR